MTIAPAPRPLLQVEDLVVSFSGQQGRVRAVNGVNFSVYPNQTLAIVGESGCGKSVSAMSILRLIPTPPGKFDSGAIRWSPPDSAPIDLLKLTEKEMQRIRGGKIAMIFQEPMTSLNPVYTIGEQIIEAILLHQKVDQKKAVDIAAQALIDVGIADPISRLKEYPHRLSGGMRQRVMIAMALACNPQLLLADEPTTALDVTIQAQILELLRKLQRERNMSVLLITHDLGVVAENADAVAVMYAGRVVEYGSVYDVFSNPLHPYTQGLFASLPVLGRPIQRLATIPGAVPNPANLPPGCPFNTRCDKVKNDPACTATNPAGLEVAPRHWVACHHAEGFATGKASRPDVPFRREDAVSV